jgi:hypothetical protein
MPAPRIEPELRAEMIAFVVANGCPRPAALQPDDAVPDEKIASHIIDQMTVAQLTMLEADMRMGRASSPLHTFEYHPYER